MSDFFRDIRTRQDVENHFKKDLYTVPEAADALGVHVQTLRAWIREGKIKVVRPSPRKTKITKRELVDFVCGNIGWVGIFS